MTEGLVELGLSAGEKVRFQRADRSRWQDGVVLRREKDGSIGLRDSDGRIRAVPVASVEVRVTGPRGGPTWEPLAERAGRIEQLKLL
ncbi:MAG TPA: hypothetical protein VMY34_06125 [Acidimicrobiales bacterium]|nr:hypothetical protein [Acidimicrobiales bacterium]